MAEKTVSHPGNPGSHIISLIDPLSRPSPRGYALHSIEYVQSCIDAGKLLELEDFRVSPRNGIVPSRKAASLRWPSSRQQRINQAMSASHQRGYAKQNGHEKYEEAGTERLEDSDENGNGRHSRKRQRKAHHIERSRKKSRVAVKQDQYHSKPKSFENDHDAIEPIANADDVNGPIDESAQKVKHKIKRERNELETACPKHAGHRWTMVEDNTIIRLCAKVRRKFSKTGVSATKLSPIEAWEDLEKQGLLPENRGADECRERAEKLQSTRSQELENRHTVEQKANNYVVRRPLTSPSDIDEDEIEPYYGKREGKSHPPHLEQRAKGPPPKQNQKRGTLGRQIEKRADKAKDFIRRNVRLLSSETKMTQRRVFQVLRSTFGDVAEAREALLRERQEMEQGKRRRHSKA
ncbi:hypothetical protein BWQ96_01328 [Gracilariopsis chorda]|uniref:Uncharacterized protein n=1 Tax=Gracilariopsis chorda TaxID=448386 RepID=A0A2V3J3S2_9FLOR|nr:hypothetical protein BWQ96_01328 [Gracilariopsis chorda]|eukprot:PXF48772.1 hypothetical protein BWQ96_01328 [Gracilariopsis chorda]